MIVSVIIACFNTGQPLRRMVDSVLAQTLSDFELLLVDDGSTDYVTQQILSEYERLDARVRVIRQVNVGANRARNTALALSQGEYVYVCDHDDALHPQALEYAIWCMRAENVKFMTFTGWRIYSDKTLKNKPLRDFSRIPYVVMSNDKNFLNTRICRNQLRKLQCDVWGQFIEGNLARSLPYEPTHDCTHTLALIRAVDRWVSSDARLYNYFKSNTNAMTTKSITLEWIRNMGHDLTKMSNLLSDGIESNKAEYKIQNRVMRASVFAKQLKMVATAIRRKVKHLPPHDKITYWHEFALILRDLFSAQMVRLMEVGFRRYVQYRYLLLRYK